MSDDYAGAIGKGGLVSRGEYRPPAPRPRRPGAEQAAAVPSWRPEEGVSMSRTETFIGVVRELRRKVTAREVWERRMDVFGANPTAANQAGLELTRRDPPVLLRERDTDSGAYLYGLPEWFGAVADDPQPEPPAAEAAGDDVLTLRAIADRLEARAQAQAVDRLEDKQRLLQELAAWTREDHAALLADLVVDLDRLAGRL